MDASSNRFLQDFTPVGKKRLIEHLIHEEFEDGVFLFREGDPADGVCLVLEGSVEIVKSAGNREEIFGCFHEGEFFGEVAVLDGFGRSTDARAKGKVALAKIPSELLLEVLDNEPVMVTLGIFQTVLNHLRKTNDLFIQEVVRKEKLSLVGEMASSLMHDLRNPISSIRLSSELITMNHQDPETVHCCEVIRLQSDRLVGMASELLEFSRGESKLNVGPTTTAAFLKQFHLLNDEYFRTTGLKFNLEAVPADIEIDSMRMLRVVQNLVTNAVEAIGTRPLGRINIRTWKQGTNFCLKVTDNGPGIPVEVRSRIFEPFVTFGKKAGTGLGMSIVQSVVAAHGGTITFETALGKGTSFLVQIPQKADSKA